MRKSTSLIYGVATYDADYTPTLSKKVNGKIVRIWSCPFYRTWKQMLDRCYSKKFHARYPTYADCEVCPEWLSFSNFRAWMNQQDWQGKHLDKDIIANGNKVYSPDTCAFVSEALNLFVSANNGRRGKYMIGVCWQKRDKKYVAQCTNPFTKKRETLGRFEDEMEAHMCWRNRKHELALQYSETQTDERLVHALKMRYEPYGNTSAGIREAVRQAQEQQQ